MKPSRKRFVVKEQQIPTGFDVSAPGHPPVSFETVWALYWVGADGFPEPRQVATVYDLDTLALLVSAPMLQHLSEARAPRGYTKDTFGRFQEMMGRVLKRTGF